MALAALMTLTFSGGSVAGYGRDVIIGAGPTHSLLSLLPLPATNSGAQTLDLPVERANHSNT